MEAIKAVFVWGSIIGIGLILVYTVARLVAAAYFKTRDEYSRKDHRDG